LTTLDTASDSPVRTRTTQRAHRAIPLSRIISTELRKMFDTRSGFWLMASIGILALLATAAVILFAPDKELTLVAIPVSYGIGALGNLVGTAIAGVDPV
jgi:ABC-2 type transport system permease protein